MAMSAPSNYVLGQSTREYERLMLQGRTPASTATQKGLERARQRTVEQGCSSWVSFQATNLDDFSPTEHFDAVVGR